MIACGLLHFQYDGHGPAIVGGWPLYFSGDGGKSDQASRLDSSPMLRKSVAGSAISGTLSAEFWQAMQ